jgi:hypothetical protein
MSRVAFYVGVSVFLIGLIVWIVRPDNSRSRSTIKALGMEFSLGAPAFVVMVLGIVLMVLSQSFPVSLAPALPPPGPIKKVVCTGQFESNCPGAHDVYYACGYFGSDKEIADNLCKGIKAGVVRLKTIGGNMCGYALIEVTCS